MRIGPEHARQRMQVATQCGLTGPANRQTQDEAPAFPAHALVRSVPGLAFAADDLRKLRRLMGDASFSSQAHPLAAQTGASLAKRKRGHV